MKYLRDILARLVAGDSATTMLASLDPVQKGHVGEALLRLLVLFGIHPTDATATVTPYKVLTGSRRIEAISFAERVGLLSTGLINAGASGKIDVAWRDSDGIAVCSSKIGKGHVKSIADLEILPMLAEFTESGGLTEQGTPVPREHVKPYALVENGETILRLAESSKASNRATKDNLHPIDMDDLNRMCAVFRDRVAGCASSSSEALLSHVLGDTKPMLRTRLHQKLICAKAKRLLGAGEHTVLIGALPRSGKTWMGAEIAKDRCRILVLTTRPSETVSQWNAVFATHRDFSGHTVSDLDAASVGTIVARNRAGAPVVAIASTQFLKVGNKDVLAALVGLAWDLVILDEVHAGGSTELSAAMLLTYTGDASRVMMTSTYTRPVAYYGIPAHCCLYWDLEDVRLMREWGAPHVVERLGEKYGVADVEIARDATYASGETDASIRACYTHAPRLGILTTAMQADIYNELRVATSAADNVYGFSMRSLLMTTKDGSAFQNPKAVDTFLALLTGSNKMQHYKRGDMSMFARIRRYWKTVAHRDGDEFLTQIWFLPSGVGQLLEHVKGAMMDRIRANAALKHYAVMTLDAGMGDISKAVTDAVVDARTAGQQGLILLTGNVGSLGVSLPEVDVAFLMHDMESADLTYQQMMRVLTEMRTKSCGLVVDFNVWRVLTTLNTYATGRCGQTSLSSADRIRWCISHLVDIDPDLWQTAESPSAFTQHAIADELTKQWRTMLVHSGSSLHTLSRRTVDLGEDQVELDRIAKYHGVATSVGSHMIAGEQERLAAGIEQQGDSGSSDEEAEEAEEVAPPKCANLNEILARLIPEIALLSGSSYDLLEGFTAVAENPRQRAALNEFLTQLYG